MTRNELKILAEKIRNATGKTKERNDAMLIEFIENVLRPSASGLFCSVEYNDLSSEQIVDMALSYKPIVL